MVLELYGVTRSIDQKYIGGGFEVFESRELVATFSSRKKLDAFLKPRLLKNPIEQYGFEPGRKFRKNSDMEFYSDYEVEEIDVKVEVPHDPE